MHCTYIGKSTACVAYRKPFTGISFEEEQACIFFCGISRFFFIGINIVKDYIAVFSMAFHIVCNLYRFVGVKFALKVVTNLSDYIIKKRDLIRSLVSFISLYPKVITICLVVQFLAHLFGSIQKLLYGRRWSGRMEDSIGNTMVPLHRYYFQ